MKPETIIEAFKLLESVRERHERERIKVERLMEGADYGGSLRYSADLDAGRAFAKLVYEKFPGGFFDGVKDFVEGVTS